VPSRGPARSDAQLRSAEGRDAGGFPSNRRGRRAERRPSQVTQIAATAGAAEADPGVNRFTAVPRCAADPPGVEGPMTYFERVLQAFFRAGGLVWAVLLLYALLATR